MFSLSSLVLDTDILVTIFVHARAKDLLKQQRDKTKWKDASVPWYEIASSWLQELRVEV